MYFFPTRDLIGVLQTKTLADTCRYTVLFLEEKLTKCERCTIETLINNSLIKERVFLLFE